MRKFRNLCRMTLVQRFVHSSCHQHIGTVHISLQFFPLPVEDYLLGLSDLTGELMRYAISAISRRGGRSTANEVCSFVRSIKAGEATCIRYSPFILSYYMYTDFERFIPYSRDLRKKQHVTSQSLEKMEDGAHNLPPLLTLAATLIYFARQLHIQWSCVALSMTFHLIC